MHKNMTIKSATLDSYIMTVVPKITAIAVTMLDYSIDTLIIY